MNVTPPAGSFEARLGPFPIAYDGGMLGLVLAMHAGAEALPDHPRWIRDHMGGRVVAFRERLLPQIRAFTNLREMDILDFGCGSGSTTVVLGEAAVGSRITGIDIDARGLEIARRRLRHHDLADRVELFQIRPVGRAGDLPFASASFDFILANGVLEHVVPFAARPQVVPFTDPEQAVLEMWRLLRPDGLLYFHRGWRGMTYWGVVRPLRRSGARFEVLNLTAGRNRLLPAGPGSVPRPSAKRRAATFVLETVAGKPLAALGVPAVALGPFLEHLCLRKADVPRDPSLMNIAFATCVQRAQFDDDAPRLATALEARGHTAREAAWDDPAVDWRQFDVVLLRSTWNYFHDRDAFLAWAARVAAHSTLWNPLEIVRWNTHKFYLRDLSARGVPILPTLFVEAGTRLDLAVVLAERDWEAAVLKPAVSADSFATARVDRGVPAHGQAHLDTYLPQRDMLVQRYAPAVVEPGERCLVFVDGEYSHAVRKQSLFHGSRATCPEGIAVEAATDEITVARDAILQSGFPTPLYARVDLLRDPSGVPCLMELELVEPSLFFEARPEAALHMAAALEARTRSA